MSQPVYAHGAHVAAPGAQVMYVDGAHAGGYVDGAYVTENYVGPISIVLGCILLGPLLCPLVFACPVRATTSTTRDAIALERATREGLKCAMRTVTDDRCADDDAV